MSVQYDTSGGWAWTCIWGCKGYQFDTEEEAKFAFLNHDCHSKS